MVLMPFGAAVSVLLSWHVNGKGPVSCSSWPYCLLGQGLGKTWRPVFVQPKIW